MNRNTRPEHKRELRIEKTVLENMESHNVTFYGRRFQTENQNQTKRMLLYNVKKTYAVFNVQCRMLNVETLNVQFSAW